MKTLMRLVAIGAASTLGFAMQAAEVQKLDNPAVWNGQGKPAQDGDKAVTQLKGPWTRCTSKEQIKIDPAKSYKISGAFRAPESNQKPVGVYLGFQPFSADKKQINSENSAIVRGAAMTELAAAAKAGDKVVKVKNAANWKMTPHLVLAFGAKADLSDLPNFDIAPIADIKQNGDVYDVTLKNPLKKDIAADTPVRLQSYGATYIYTGAGNAIVPKEWTTFSGTIQGTDKGLQHPKKWREGSEYTEIIVVLRTEDKNDAVLFKDIVLEELD